MHTGTIALQFVGFLVLVGIFVFVYNTYVRQTSTSEGFGSCYHCRKKGQSCTWSHECPVWSWGCWGKKCH